MNLQGPGRTVYRLISYGLNVWVDMHNAFGIYCKILVESDISFHFALQN